VRAGKQYATGEFAAHLPEPFPVRPEAGHRPRTGRCFVSFSEEIDMQLRIGVNETGILRNQRFAFSNPYTLVSELMQNARRAGASYVAIEYAPSRNLLSVRDDGCGIADFQPLLTIGESGWQTPGIEAEHPFGQGFSQCFYTARHCTVRSMGKEISFDTQEALQGAWIEVHDTTLSPETVVILTGVVLERLDEHMPSLACGFPIEVQFNGKVLARPHALDAIQRVETEVGLARVAGLDTGRATRRHLVFLQGFAVHGDWWDGEHVNLVHLDPRRFIARLPDRDQLIDEEAQLERIDVELRKVWRARLIAAKRALDAVEFAQRYFQAATRWDLIELFDDVPALPGSLFQRITGYPIQAGYRDTEYLRCLDRPVLKDEVERGRIKLVEMEDVEEATIPHWLYARERDLILFRSCAVGPRHWIQSYVRPLCEEPCEVQVINESARSTLKGASVASEVALCEAYSIAIGGNRVVIRNDAMYWRGMVLVPEDECSGQAVRQASAFIDSNGRWHEEDEQLDTQALSDLIALLRASEPGQALGALIARLRLESYPRLHGKVFRLKVGASLDRHEVRLLSV
jgi:hypothetical protein